MSSPEVVLFLPSLAGGGAERVFVELANQFAAEGVRVDLVLCSATGPYLGEVAPAVRIVDLGVPRVLRALPRLARHLRREKPASVLSALDHSNVVAVAARTLAARRTRCVVSTRVVPTMLSVESGAAAADKVMFAARLVYRFADAVIANSGAVADDMAAYLRVPRRRINVIYNPLGLDFIRRQSEQPVAHPFCAPGAPPLVLSAGRMSPLKDFPTLVRAFAQVRARRDCRLVILGEGPDFDAVRGLVRELGIEQDVALPGFDRNPFAWMRHARVFVSSSLSEGCPNVLMQALACGTPVVSTRSIGGAAEILEDGRWGTLVPVGDPQAMADAIDATLDASTHPDGRLRAADFALDRVARQYLAIVLPERFPPAKKN
jgi:glycosyltransferase involved in cell wall biosynthesis